jgi:hypothetical protein
MSDALASEIRTLASLLGRPGQSTEMPVLELCLCIALARRKVSSAGHCGRLPLKDLPEWDWREISAHSRCSKCGTVGYVDTRMDLSEVTPAQMFSIPSAVAVIRQENTHEQQGNKDGSGGDRRSHRLGVLRLRI